MLEELELEMWRFQFVWKLHAQLHIGLSLAQGHYQPYFVITPDCIELIGDVTTTD